jgi:ADP-ribose pyrophosphatase
VSPRMRLVALWEMVMKPWKTKNRLTVLDQRPWLVVKNNTVELPDGRLIPDWPWIITPDYVNVVAVTADERFLCFRQAKYGLEGITLSIVGGFVEEGEEPIQAVRRELLEETGYESTDWMPLGSYRVDPNRGVAMGHLYLARQARYVTPRNADDLEEQKLILLTRVEIETALARGEFKVLAWAASVALALRQLSSRVRGYRPGG